MIPAQFDYERVDTVDAAIAALQADEGAKLLAGGHSLLPQMKLRFAMPTKLIDIGRLHDLSYVREDGGGVAIGALTRYHDLEASEELRQLAPIVASVAGQVGDPQVRHMGTIGGSVAHADPAGDMPSVLLALGATFVATGSGGMREIAAADMFPGLFQSALASDEVLTEIRRAEDAGRLELSEVHPAGPGLGRRGRGGGADERQRERVAHEHGAHPDARHRRGGGPGGRGRPRDRRRAGRRGSAPPSDSFGSRSTAGRSRRCSFAARWRRRSDRKGWFAPPCRSTESGAARRSRRCGDTVVAGVIAPRDRCAPHIAEDGGAGRRNRGRGQRERSAGHAVAAFRGAGDGDRGNEIARPLDRQRTSRRWSANRSSSRSRRSARWSAPAPRRWASSGRGGAGALRDRVPRHGRRGGPRPRAAAMGGDADRRRRVRHPRGDRRIVARGWLRSAAAKPELTQDH